MFSNIETKVIAAAAGGGIGSAVGTFLVWVLGVTLWHASNAADQAEHAIAAVPLPVATLLLGLVSLLGAAVAGYQAPHTERPDLTPPPIVLPPPSGTTKLVP